MVHVDPVYGPLFGHHSLAEIYLPQPEGNYVVYEFELGPWVERATSPWGRYRIPDYSCSDNHHGDQLMHVEEHELRLLVTEGDQQLFVLDPEDERYRKDRPRDLYPDDGSFAASVPFVFWKDPFGRFIELLRSDLHPPNLCEPVLYVYGRQEPFTVTLDEQVHVTVSDPPIDGHGWTLLPTGDGGVTVPGSDRAWPFLFWEGQNGLFARPDGGTVVARSEVRDHLRRVLPLQGLRGREVDDFVRAWAPDLEESPYVLVSFHPRDDIDRLVPMRIEPEPDTLIRVMMEYEPRASGGGDVRPQPLPAVPPRRGFVVVEWGGVKRQR